MATHRSLSMCWSWVD